MRRRAWWRANKASATHAKSVPIQTGKGQRCHVAYAGFAPSSGHFCSYTIHPTRADLARYMPATAHVHCCHGGPCRQARPEMSHSDRACPSHRAGSDRMPRDRCRLQTLSSACAHAEDSFPLRGTLVACPRTREEPHWLARSELVPLCHSQLQHSSVMPVHEDSQRRDRQEPAHVAQLQFRWRNLPTSTIAAGPRVLRKQ
jgi:hypothetical protein